MGGEWWSGRCVVLSAHGSVLGEHSGIARERRKNEINSGEGTRAVGGIGALKRIIVDVDADAAALTRQHN